MVAFRAADSGVSGEPGGLAAAFGNPLGEDGVWHAVLRAEGLLGGAEGLGVGRVAEAGTLQLFVGVHRF